MKDNFFTRSDEDKRGVLTFKSVGFIASTRAYTIFDEDINVGSVIHTGKTWHARIPCLEIDDSDEFRNDLFERVAVLYEERAKK
jgi:hypothetical protein